MKKRSIFIIALIILVISGCTKKVATYEQTVENGIRITKNTGVPADSTFKVALREVGFIYNENETDSARFIEKSYYCDFDKDGNFYILDFKRSKIHKYDKNCKYVLSFGGKGEGPGEFMFSGRICINQDTIYIPDWYSRKLIRYDLNGNHISSKIYEDPNFMPSYPKVFGSYYISASINSKTISSMPNIVTLSSKSSIYDHSFNYIKDIYNLMWEYDKSKDYDPSANGASSANSETELYIAEKSKDLYLISVYDNAGNKLREIKKQFARIRISDDESKKLEEKGAIYKLKYKMTYKSSINNINVDKYGRLWVDTPAANSDKKYFDVFENDIFLNRINLNLDDSFSIQFVGDKIIAINENNNNIKIYEY